MLVVDVKYTLVRSYLSLRQQNIRQSLAFSPVFVYVSGTLKVKHSTDGIIF